MTDEGQPSREMEVRIGGATLRLQLGDHELMRAQADVRLSDGRFEPRSQWEIERADGGALVRLRFRNDSASAVRVEQLRPLVANSGFQNARLDELQVYQCGWQSWSRSHPSAPFEANFTSGGPPIRGPLLPHRRRDSQIEPWMTILRHAGTSLLLGFVGAREQLGTIEIAPNGAGHTVTVTTELDGIAIAPGAEVVSEPLLIALGTESELLELYARAAAERMHARRQEHVLTGWCSWYQLYTSVSEADVDRNLASLAGQRERVPLELIQLDDGYQHAVGDWLELNDKFPSGMPALVQRIKHEGYVPGLWLAPFLLSAQSHTYAQHPDWVVRDEGGEPVNALDNWGAANYAVDTTRPDVLEWLAQVIDTVCNNWGYDYLKLDFLYAAAMRGRRFDPDATGVQAYRRGLELLRRIAGDRFILGCGAPLVPSIGLVDGMRIGSDVAAYWGNEGNSDGPSLRNATRATLARMWMHGTWWTNDPDCVVIRASDTDLSLAEVQGWLGAVALSGGMLFVGDDVSRVESQRVDMLARLIPPSGTAARAVSGETLRNIPERLHLRIERSFGTWSIVGVANWRDVPSPRVLQLHDFGLGGGAYHVVDLWTGEYLGRTETELDLGTLPPHAMRLLALHPDLGRPQTIGGTGHLLGDALDLAAEEWDASQGVLTLHVAPGGPPARRGDFIVADAHGGARRVPFASTDSQPIRVTFG